MGISVIVDSFMAGLILILGAALAGYLGYKFEPERHLILRTSSGDTQALTTKDPAFLERVKDAVEQAVAARG